MDTVCSTSQGTRPSLFCGLQRHDHDARFRPYFQDAKLLSYGGHCSLFLVQKYDGASAFLFEAHCPIGGALVARLAALGERIGNPALVAWRGYQGWVIADRVEEPLLSSYLEGDLAEGARAVLARNFVDLTCTMVDRGLLPLDWGKLVLQVTATGYLRIFEVAECFDCESSPDAEPLVASVRSYQALLHRIAPNWHEVPHLRDSIRASWQQRCPDLSAAGSSFSAIGVRFFRLLLNT